MRFKPTKQRQNEALAGVFELYHNPINDNRYDHYIYSFLNALMLYPDSVENVTKLVNEINNCLDEPLSKEEQNQAFDILMQELRNDLFN